MCVHKGLENFAVERTVVLGTVNTAAFGALSFRAGGFKFRLLAMYVYRNHAKEAKHVILVQGKRG